MRSTLVSTFVVAALLSGCSGNRSQADKPAEHVKVEQATYCEAGIESLFSPPECEPGQKIVFLPNQFGNEQLPVLFAARNCDLRYNVAMTRGGVTCIYAPGKAQEKKGSREIEKSQPGKNGG